MMLLTHVSLAIALLLNPCAAGKPGGATLAPAGFDCKTRHLAMEYARKIQPFRSASDFRYTLVPTDVPLRTGWICIEILNCSDRQRC